MAREHPADSAAELKAAIAARRELGPEMEDDVIEAFLSRLDQRLEGRLAPREAALPVRTPKGEPVNPAVPIGTLGIAIPLLAIGGSLAGHFGVFLVIVGVVIVNLLYFIDRWVRFN